MGGHGVPFLKGHGTGNDFVVLPDVEGRLDLGPDEVRWLCDRHCGIGADGILRVVRTAQMPQAAHLADQAEFFMDHRNADGSLAQMCGNGARLFARYLVDAGLVTGDRFRIMTRGGIREVWLADDGVLGRGAVTVDMGPATTPRLRAAPVVEVGDRTWPAVGVLMPNPHAVVFVADLDQAGALTQAPSVVPASVFPDGVNVEFVRVLAEDHIAMRVHERGVGETLACGTGACAAAWATARRAGQALSRPIRVDMPGGSCLVSESASGLLLTGPAEFVAEGTAFIPAGPGLRSV